MNEEKFSGKADIYAKYRPDYPSAFLDYLYKEIGFNAKSIIADIGAGTGILSRQLLQRGSKVICVEPNKDMLVAAKKELDGFNKVRFIEASAENTGMESHCVDFVTVAQAFHWFDGKLFKTECQRILKDNGKVVLVWNNKDSDSPIIKEMAEVNAKYCKNFKGFSGGAKTGLEAYAGFFRDGNCEYKTFRNDKTENEEEFIGRCLTASYAPKESSENYQTFVRELQNIFKKYSKNGMLTLPQTTRSYIGNV